MKKILLVDDNEDYLEILELVLSRKYVTRSCRDAKDMAQIIAEFDPDLILIDHFLGFNTSTEVFHMLKSSKTGQHIPAVLISGIEDIAQKAKEMGAVGFISKPNSVEYIRKYIDDFFEYRFGQ